MGLVSFAFKLATLETIKKLHPNPSMSTLLKDIVISRFYHEFMFHDNLSVPHLYYQDVLVLGVFSLSQLDGLISFVTK